MKKIISIVLMLIMMVLPLASCASAPTIEISEDGYWVINGEKTNISAKGEKGDKGDQGIQGIQGEKGDKGDPGEKGDKGDTGAHGAQGEKGDKGDTGAQGAQGEKGDDGDTPTIEISDDGYWVINGVKTNVKAEADSGSSAPTNENPQGLAFYLKDDGTYAVGMGTTKYLSKIIIPSTYRGKAVTEIAEFGFVTDYHGGEKNYLTEIVIPDSVKIIGENAFEQCDSLLSVTIPESVIEIGDSAFSGCRKLIEVYNLSSLDVSSVFDDALVIHTSLEEESILEKKGNFVLLNWEGECYLLAYIENDTETVTIPEGVTIICEEVFEGCTSITSITIPDSVTSIGRGAFYGCAGLTSITIPGSVTSIGDRAFYHCTGLESVTISEGVESIGDSAFNGCTGLTSITIPGSVTSMGDYAFYRCTGLTSITISEGVESIGEWAFPFCDTLTSITIPSSVTSIGDYAFEGCYMMANVYYTGTEDEWNALVSSIGYGNSYLKNATIHFNYIIS